jgi:hypothetical protein
MDEVPRKAVERTVNPVDFLTEAERVALNGRAVDMRDVVMLHVPMDESHARQLQAILLSELALTLLRQRGVNEAKPETAIAAAVRKINENRPLPPMPLVAMDRIIAAAEDLVRMAKTAELDVQECQGSKVTDVRAGCKAIAELAASIPAYAGGTKLRIES